jgi:3-methyladenine DNA glycosylase AlkC
MQLSSMPAESSPPAQLKDWFNEPLYRSLASLLQSASTKFDSKRFLASTLDGLPERSLMQRMHQTSLAVHSALPGSFRQKVATLQKIAPSIGHDFIGIFLSDFVATFGLDDPDFSLQSLHHFTRFGSAEFAIRPFIQRDLERTLQVMRTWTTDPNEHVRRLASEGSRPRLPWGLRLQALVQNPDPTAPILDALRDDPALYVRKSVANHLNDITKDHPHWVLDRLTAWNITESPHRQWIAKHACRTLIKRGHPQALELFGFGQKPALTATLTVTPKSLHLGQHLTLSTTLTSTSRKAQTLAIDYIVHYVRANENTSEKVFKWTEVTLPPGATLDLAKKQTFRDFTTRRHYPGHHRIELQINGHRLAETAFTLQ